MATYATARAAAIAAIDELDNWQAQPTLSSQLASIATLQAANAALTAARDARQAAIDAAQAALQAF